MSSVQGLAKLKRQLRGLRDLETGLQKQAMPEAVAIVEQEAERLAPGDEGELRDGIGVEGMPSQRHEAAVALVSRAEHAGYVEFGTSNMSARPHIRPAVQGKKKTFWSFLRDWANKFLRQAAR